MTGILVNKRSFDNFAPTEAIPVGRMPDHPSDRAGPERKKLGPESRLWRKRSARMLVHALD